MGAIKSFKYLALFFILSTTIAHATPNVTIEEIFATHESNVARFDLKYKGKTIEIIGTARRIIGLDESLNYKESARKRWGYLTEFSVNQRKIICFSDDAKDAAYSTPNELAYVSGFLADIDNHKMVITYCTARNPRNSAASLSDLPAKNALEKLMLCDQYFEPAALWEKMIDENYIKSTIKDIYWDAARNKEMGEYFDNEKKDKKNDKGFYESDYPKRIKILKKLEFYGLEVDYIYGFDIERNSSYDGAARTFTNFTLIFNKNVNLEKSTKQLLNRLSLKKGNEESYFGANNYSLANDNILRLAVDQDKILGNRVTLDCVFVWFSKSDLKTY